jgi:hypothetical protein
MNLEWKLYPENEPETAYQGQFLVKGRTATSNGLSATHLFHELQYWNGYEFGLYSTDFMRHSSLWNPLQMVVEEYVQVE